MAMAGGEQARPKGEIGVQFPSRAMAMAGGEYQFDFVSYPGSLGSAVKDIASPV